MSQAISSITDSIDRLYRGFVLRDLLGFILPGAIFLSSLWCLITSTNVSACTSFDACAKHLLTPLVIDGFTVKTLVFLGASFLAAWVIQSVHFGFVDWMYQIAKHHQWWSFLWPLAGVVVYARRIDDVFGDHTTTIQNPSPSLVTNGAIAPDITLKKLKGNRATERMGESTAYTERLSALMLMTSNLAIAGVPLVIFMVRQLGLHWWGVLGIVALVFLYLEYWRLLYARNLRHELLVDAASNENSLPSGPAA